MVSACAAIAAAAAALIAFPFTVRAANAAKKQTDLQREVAEQAKQPYVWADIPGGRSPRLAAELRRRQLRADDCHARHNHRGSATAVGNHEHELTKQAFDRMRHGIETLAPGRVIKWALSGSPDLLTDDGPQPYTITVAGQGPYGPLQVLKYVVDLSDFRESNDSPNGSLHQPTKAVTAIEKKLG